MRCSPRPPIHHRERLEPDVLDPVAAKLCRRPLRRIIVRGRSGKPSAESIRQFPQRVHGWPYVNRAGKPVRRLANFRVRLGHQSAKKQKEKRNHQCAAKIHLTFQKSKIENTSSPGTRLSTEPSRTRKEIEKLGRLHILLGRKLLVIPSAARNLVLWLAAGRGRFLAALGMTKPFKLQITRLPNYKFPNYKIPNDSIPKSSPSSSPTLASMLDFDSGPAPCAS